MNNIEEMNKTDKKIDYNKNINIEDIEYFEVETNEKVDTYVNNFIAKWLPDSFAHLADTDECDGQLLRVQLTNLLNTEVQKAVEDFVDWFCEEKCKEYDDELYGYTSLFKEWLETYLQSLDKGDKDD